MSMANLNRATKNGFTAYMTANPVYFEQRFRVPATPSNIQAGYKEAMRLRKTVPHFPKRLDDNDELYIVNPSGKVPAHFTAL